MSDDAATPDLTFVDTSDLIDEMFRRHEAIAIVRIPKGQHGAQAMVDHNGPFYAVLGLATQLRHDLLTRAGVPTDPDD